jgi:gluconate 2-dehydrogenase gamma chain
MSEVMNTQKTAENSTPARVGDPGDAHSESPVSRRLIVKAALTLPVLGVIGCTRVAADSAAPVKPIFFDAAERNFIDAATQRLIPDGDDGLGAKAARVGEFIDRQLAGVYGRAATWYMQGPWKKGTPEQGYQLALTPAELYRTAIRAIDGHCQDSYGQVFAALAPAEQDKLLHALEKGELELPDTSAKEFFDMLLKNTQEGFLADPLYGGNRNFAGWRLIGFPGPRYNYVFEITQYGKPYPLPTVGLLGRDGNQVWS